MSTDLWLWRYRSMSDCCFWGVPVSADIISGGKTSLSSPDEVTARSADERKQLIVLHEIESAAYRREIEGLVRMIDRQEAELEQAQEELETVKRISAEQIAELTSQSAIDEERMQERFREIAGLSRLIRERDQIIVEERSRAEWLRKIAAVLTRGYSRSLKGRLASLTPAFAIYRQQKSRLEQEGLFNVAAYVATYPDVARTDVDPLRHYIIHGMNEARVIQGRS